MRAALTADVFVLRFLAVAGQRRPDHRTSLSGHRPRGQGRLPAPSVYGECLDQARLAARADDQAGPLYFSNGSFAGFAGCAYDAAIYVNSLVEARQQFWPQSAELRQSMVMSF